MVTVKLAFCVIYYHIHCNEMKYCKVAEVWATFDRAIVIGNAQNIPYRHYIIGKHTEQSSYHNAFESHYGADGNISSIFHTFNHEIGDWFRVDLGMSYCIKAVNLINRQHGSSDSKLILSKIWKNNTDNHLFIYYHGRNNIYMYMYINCSSLQALIHFSAVRDHNGFENSRSGNNLL